MTANSSLVNGARQNLAAIALCALILALGAWIYWPGITGPELLDDRSSVLVIADLQESPELAWDYVFGDRSGPLGRTVSMASFVLEKLYLNEGTVGSKKLNIVLHLCNGGLVIWLLWLLFRYLAVPGYAWLAVTLGAIWLLHPLMVSSVLYVVQRMAMLATFFMLLSAISYVYWRQRVSVGHPRLVGLVLVLLFFALAMLSKENAIVLVPTLLVLEVLWFQCRSSDGARIRWLQLGSYGLIGVGTLGLLAVLVLRWEQLAAKFVRRPFSLEERLLTEGRVVWDYVGQLLWPDVSRMGLYQDDVIVSTAWQEPVATQYALLGWLALLLVFLLLLRRQWGRYIALGIAWFVLGHSVESTVLPLELYFEHRNYFPAIGVLIVVGAVWSMLVHRWRESMLPLLVWLGAASLLLSGLTSSQVQVWSSRPLLILAHLNGHPNSARANIDMATQMAQLGSEKAAHRYSARAFAVSTVEREGDWAVRDLALSCIAVAPISHAQIDRIGTVNARRPLGSVTTLLTLVRMLQDDQCPGMDRIYFADHLVQIYLQGASPASASKNMYSNLAVLENSLQRYDYALAYVEKVLQKSPRDKRGLLMKLHFASSLGERTVAKDAMATLQELERQGKLTVREQQTLALYTEI